MELSRTDTLRAVAVAVTAAGQVASAALVPMAGTDTGTISDANLSPVTPAGYAFAIWGLIYLASLALAIYQLLPSQRGRLVHRRTGWWLAAGFLASAVWVPIFNSGAIWVSQVVITLLLGCLAAAAVRLSRLSPARDLAERLLLRLPVTVYLGWVTLATAAGFGTTLRSLGMPPSAGWVTWVSLLLVAAATVASVLAVSRLTATAGFAFTSSWALVAVAVGTYVEPVQWAALLGLMVVLAALVLRTARSADKPVVLLG